MSSASRTATYPVFTAQQPPSAPAGVPQPQELGAYLRDGGLDVVVFASHASAVDLCLLDPAPEDPAGWRERRWRLHQGPYGNWHGHVPDVAAGQRYGLRVHGRWDPAAGLRYNPAKLLLDPYARGVTGELELRPPVFAHAVDDDLCAVEAEPASDLDSAGFVPHGVVLARSKPLDSPRPWVPWQDTVIYEAHVRGLTMRLPGIPEELRGTYAGLAHPVTIDHLRGLGITTLELLPIQSIVSEPFLLEQGLGNYWGYNTLGFFAPEPRYATAGAREAGAEAVLAEVQGMVALLHEAGIEVVLDVVYNHTAEGGALGPTMSLRGVDNTMYYLHDDMHPTQLVDVTGCGNTLDFRRRQVVKLALDSLRYWVEVVGVDGFRFDLATTLGREAAEFNPFHPFLVALTTDSVLSQVKLIAEPWDMGPGGWRTGQFPAPMTDWNDRFRNTVRSFWLADPAAISAGGHGDDMRELATRLAGSADLFTHGLVPGGRGPLASINYITAHDGFTLADLVAYDHKHNEANGEDNRDGTDDNRSWNHGTEGPSEDRELAERRQRSMRNVLGTLLLSAGTPMITAGDEQGRSQGGNNNAYCQDNEISWLSWQLTDWQRDLHATTAHLLRLRREHPVVRPDFFAAGAVAEGDSIPDLSWFTAQAEPMTSEHWHDPHNRVLQMLRSGFVMGDADALLVINGCLADVEVVLPAGREGCPGYELVWDSAWRRPPDDGTPGERKSAGDRKSAGETVSLVALSMRCYLTRQGP